MRGSPTEKPRLPLLKAVRFVIVVPILLNVTLIVLAAYVAEMALHSKYPNSVVTGVNSLASVTFTRLIWLIINGCIQAVTASVMVAENPSEGNNLSVNYRRRWYRLWRWWNRVGLLVLILQVLASCYIVRNNNSIRYGNNDNRFQALLIILPVTSLVVVILGLFTGSEVFSWHLLYTRRIAWKAHYTEAFRCFIREALCCLGRYRYLAKEQNEEVCSVAELLGHLVTYRAEGCSQLEVLAGVSFLRKDLIDKKNPAPKPASNPASNPAPDDLLHEASILHPFAVASYTGPLLELGRYPHCWILVWLYSQGFCSFWKRRRRPVLKGDNLWRGHAAAFLRHSRLTPEDGYLRIGRVLQTEREPAYFVVVWHKLRIVVVAVRGTETPEDLLTDGLSRETPLSKSDLLGVLEGLHDLDEVEGKKHYAHSGIIEAARELSLQLDNLAEDDDDAMAASDKASIGGHKDEELAQGSGRGGLLTDLFGPTGDCKGYQLRLVGHSLGGSICALTGLRLYRRYPNLHVYAFGALPCVDDVIAKSCQNFITSVVYHDEFSSRLSVASLMRLRVEAEVALSDNITSDKHSTVNIALQAESTSSSGRKEYSELRKVPPALCSLTGSNEVTGSKGYTSSDLRETDEGQFMVIDLEMQSFNKRFTEDPSSVCSGHDALSRKGTGAGFLNSSDEEAGGNLRLHYPSEMYLPGEVLHILPRKEPRKEEPVVSWWASFWNAWKSERKSQYEAFVVDRNEFRDLVISPSMFIDHMPWKCQHALNTIVKDLP
ncbi:hypothetical protein KC19_VG073500 [Ceratodon purpureus]|uniref:Fungal lipase-like domain-containing protein n=1 Tax=Ceratodon purpureus TaxID=3225 RepID=A0A8T0HNC3_CERPU|nr:hypothetical protein KC19_VG073500 [Ceratodon purpureus]